MATSRRGGARQYEAKKARRRELLGFTSPFFFLAALLLTRVHVPPGPLLYLGLLMLTYRHEDQTHPKYLWWQNLRKNLKKPPLGLAAEDSPWWMPNSMVAWTGIMVAALWGRFVPQPLPVISSLFIYAIVQAIAAAGRDQGYKDKPLPKGRIAMEPFAGAVAQLDPPEKKIPGLRFFTMLASAAITVKNVFTDDEFVQQLLWPLGVAGGVFGIILGVGHFMELGTAPWIPSSHLVKLAKHVNIDLAHSRVGPLTMTQALELGAWLGASAGLWTWMWIQRQAAIGPWKEEQDKRDMWNKRWEAVVPPDLPIYQGELQLPSAQNPTHTTAVFRIPPGCDYWAFDRFGPNLASILGTETVLIYFMNALDGDNLPIPATVGPAGFTVTWPTQQMGQNPHLRDDLDPRTLEFVTKHRVKEAFLALKLGTPLWNNMRVLMPRDQTDPDSLPLIESTWRLPHGLAAEELIKKSRTLQDKLEVPWLCVGRRPLPGGRQSEFVSIVYGALPKDLSSLDPGTARFLESMRWEQTFRVCKLYNSYEETAPYLSTHPGEFGLQVAQFGSLRGLKVAQIQEGTESLIPTIDWPFVEIVPRDADGGFNIIYGREDPLDRLYRFEDYRTQILRAPHPEPDVTFYVGVGSDGELIQFVFEDESPHLLVAGATGKGKSVLLHSMILQLATRNSPAQWELRIAEPKNEMQRYKALPHTTRFIDMSTPAKTLYQPLADMLEELVEEMEERYAMFQRLPGHVRDIQGAWRSNALRDKPPYITCLVEECADYFAKPSSAASTEAKVDWSRTQAALEQLARKSRAAGIYLVTATQRPTKDAIPAPVKGNSRRIGLGTHDNISSMIIIDRPGLETIRAPGRGLVSSNGAYRGFKGFFFGKANEHGEDEATRYLQPLLVLDPRRPLGPTARHCLQLPRTSQAA